MRKIISILTIALLVSCSGVAQKPEKKKEKKYDIVKTEEQWKKELTSIQYYVLREAGTERAFTSPLNNIKEKGLYVCAACETPLYKSDHKFDSGTGWPSFDRAIINNVELDVDYKIGYARTELKCATCGGHLGHSFNDGPRETTGERHCINGAALKFKVKNEVEKKK
jgi:peptide-methionine (R)-S-oxide reductase